MNHHIEIDIKKKLSHFPLELQWSAGNEIVALFGPSGAGKSMTLQAIAGLTEMDEGFIRVGEEKWFDSAAKINLPPQKRSVGYVFQHYALFPHMTVLKNILFGNPAPNSPEAHQEAMDLLKLFRLDNLEERYPKELSGGQRQRVALARALMRKPKILLLDEPFAALDLPTRKTLRAELKELRRKFNIPLVLVTHDLTEALAMADRLLIYDQGRIIQQGTVQEIINNPADDMVAELVGGLQRL